MNDAINELIPELDGISCFDDLIENIKNISNARLPELKLILTSFHDELIHDFDKNVKIYYKNKPTQFTRIIREKDFLHAKTAIKISGDILQTTIAFDQVTSPETLASIIQMLELGYSIHVFYKWEYRGCEKRSASSLLLRNCIKYAHSVSIAEIGMWSHHMTKRIQSIQYIDTLEFN